MLSARDSILQAHVNCFLARELDYWDQRHLVGVALPLGRLFESDRSEMLQAGAILALEQLLKAHSDSSWIEHGTRGTDLDRLRHEVAVKCKDAHVHASPLHRRLAEKLAAWVERAQQPG